MTIRARAIMRLEARLLARDPSPIVMLVLMPLLVAMLLLPLTTLAARAVGAGSPSGSVQAVAGVAIFFSVFVQGYLALAFYRDHGWRTWDRVRNSGARPAEVLVGKTTPYLLIAVAQQLLLLGAGRLFLGLGAPGSLGGFLLVAVAWATFVVSFGIALVTVCPTIERFMSLSNLIALLLAAVGGALAPLSVLPAWLQSLAPLAPSYWAMKGMTIALAPHSDMTGLLTACGVIAAFAILAAIVPAMSFRMGDRKASWGN